MIYVTGDTHGNIDCFDRSKTKIIKKDDILIVCGDFGFLWDDSDRELKKFEYLKKRKYTILFIEGTHENFNVLEVFPTVDFCGGAAIRLADNIYCLLRGYVYTIEDKKVFTFGGGQIPDKTNVVEVAPGWEKQVPTYEQMEFAAHSLKENGMSVDYIITHEPPNQICKLIDHEAPVTTLGNFFTKVSQKVEFEKWFFGALHTDRKLVSRYFAVFNDILPAEKIEKPRRF